VKRRLETEVGASRQQLEELSGVRQGLEELVKVIHLQPFFYILEFQIMAKHF
jgi:hypothetical protein